MRQRTCIIFRLPDVSLRQPVSKMLTSTSAMNVTLYYFIRSDIRSKLSQSAKHSLSCGKHVFREVALTLSSDQHRSNLYMVFLRYYVHRNGTDKLTTVLSCIKHYKYYNCIKQFCAGELTVDENVLDKIKHSKLGDRGECIIYLPRPK